MLNATALKLNVPVALGNGSGSVHERLMLVVPAPCAARPVSDAPQGRVGRAGLVSPARGALAPIRFAAVRFLFDDQRAGT